MSSNDDFRKAMDAILYYLGKANETISRMFQVIPKLTGPDTKHSAMLLAILIDELKRDAEELRKIIGTPNIWQRLIMFNPLRRASAISEFENDLKVMWQDFSALIEICGELKLQLKNSSISLLSKEEIKRYIERAKPIYDRIARIAEKDVYRMKFLENLDANLLRLWETAFHNKHDWLYHGTSVLFLKDIQLYGLDPSKISSGITRAINNVTRIYRNYGGKAVSAAAIGGGLDIFDKRPVSLTAMQDAVESARAPNLPAFIYELLDESHFKEEFKIKILASLPEDERFILKAAWRFGRILRAKNRPVLLHIKVDSSFFRYYKLPDILSDYHKFVENCIHGLNNVDFYKSPEGQRYSLSYVLNEIIRPTGNKPILEALYHFNYRGFTWPYELQVNNVPAEFIYFRANGELFHISKLNDEMVPFIE